MPLKLRSEGLRIPVDHLAASLVLHDGERFDAVLFVPPAETVAQVIAHPQPFVPVIRDGRIRLIARNALACVAVSAPGVIPLTPVTRIAKQRASVQLRSGIVICGELRWTPTVSHRRTADYLNRDELHFELHDADLTHYIVKAHVATVEEI